MEIDRGGGVRIEIGKGGLEQNVVGAGDCVPLIYSQRLLFTRIVRERVMKLLGRKRHGSMVVRGIAQRRKGYSGRR